MTLCVVVCLIYFFRTNSMCSFDKEPIWKFDSEEECKGENEGWYYVFLVVVHVYWFLEYMLRLMTQKYMFKYFKSFYSMLEILTIVPFLLLYAMLGKQSYIVQFLIMLDNFRLFFYQRVTMYVLENETTI